MDSARESSIYAGNMRARCSSNSSSFGARRAPLSRRPAQSQQRRLRELWIATARALVRDGRRFRMRVGGICMQPSLKPGDMVVVAPVSERPPRIGDILLCECDAGLRLHRAMLGPPFIHASKGYVIGADRGRHDTPIRRGDVIGAVESIERDSRRLSPRHLWAVAVLLSWLRALLSCIHRRR